MPRIDVDAFCRIVAGLLPTPEEILRRSDERIAWLRSLGIGQRCAACPLLRDPVGDGRHCAEHGKGGERG
jgi:hypothetical protein